MRCPKCQHNKSSVIDSRQAEDGNTIRRRRECDTCHTRFTTFERVEEVPLLVVKKDGTREQFSRDKIFNGILMSAQKRPVSSEDIENAITRIEQNIRRNHDGEVDSEVIGNLVMKELADLDEITYVRLPVSTVLSKMLMKLKSYFKKSPRQYVRKKSLKNETY